MWEGIVEKILTRYLSPYVFGLEKKKLAFGLLAGDLTLNDFFIKPELTQLFDLPINIDYGRIGKLTLSLPWGKWFSSSFALKVTASKITLFASPRQLQSSEGTADEVAAKIIAQLREAKLKQVQHREAQAVDLWLSSEAVSEEKEATSTSSFSVRLLQRILGGVTFDIESIIISYDDSDRNLCIGAACDTVSIYNTNPEGIRIDGPTEQGNSVENDVLHKAAEVRGFSIFYGRLYKKPAEDTDGGAIPSGNTGTRSEDDMDQSNETDPNSDPYEPSFHSDGRDSFGSLTQEDADSTPRAHDNPRVSLENVRKHAITVAYDHLALKINDAIHSNATTSAFSLPIGLDPHSGAFSADYMNTSRRNISIASDGNMHSSTEVTLSGFQYVVHPLSSLLRLKQSRRQKLTCATLEIDHKFSDGISIDREQLKAFLESSREAQMRQKHYHRLLMAESSTISLDPDSLQGITKEEFMALYSKQLQFKLELSRVALTDEDEQRLQTLHDVVPARYLIQWRSKCSIAAEKWIRARDIKRQAELEEMRKQQSWWSKVTNRQTEADALLKVAEQGKDNQLLTEEELSFVQESLKQSQTNAGNEADDAFTIDGSTMQWSFSISLQHFALILMDQPTFTSTGELETRREFLTVTLHGINMSLDLTPRVDHELRDVYQWRFHGGLAKFETSIFGKPLMYFQRQVNDGLNVPQRRQSLISDETSPNMTRNSFFEAVEDEVDLIKESAKDSVDSQSIPEINYIDVTNEISRMGHTLMIGLELKPLVTRIQPETIRKLIEYFSFETSETFSDEIDRLKEIQRTIGYNERSFLGDIVAEQAEKLRSRVIEEQMNENEVEDKEGQKRTRRLVYINISLSAPIIILEDAELGSLKLNLGCCKLQTPTACPIREFTLDVNLRETQLRYNNTPTSLIIDTDGGNLWSEDDKIAINPIPVHIQFSTKRLKELVVQANIEQMVFRIDLGLLSLLRAFQKSLSKDLSAFGSKKPIRQRTDEMLTPLQGETSPRLLLASENDELRDERMKLETSLMNKRVTVESLITKVSIGKISVTCTSSTSDTSDLCLTALGLAADYQFYKNGEKLLSVSTAFLSLEDLQRKIPIFTTLVKSPMDLTENLSFRQSASQPTSFQDSIETPVANNSLEQAFKMLLWKSGSDPTKPEAINPSLFSRNKEVQLHPAMHICVSTSPMEAQWYKDSIHDILVTIDLYRDGGKSKRSDTTPDEKGNEDAGLWSALVSEEISRSSSANPNNPQGVKLKVSEELPKFVHTAVEERSVKNVVWSLQFSSKGIAISFLETNGKTLCRMGLQDLDLDYVAVNEHGEAEMEVSIGWGEVTVSDRCVLAPKASAQETTLEEESNLSQNRFNQVEDLYGESRKLLTASYRSYDWIKGNLPYSSCMKACVASVSYVYYQQDLSKVIRYLSGSILETILWQSYEVAKNLAKESHFLYAVTIEEPQFILSEDKSAIPQMFYGDLFSHHTGGYLSEQYATTASPSITSSEVVTDQANISPPKRTQSHNVAPPTTKPFDINTFKGGFRSEEIFERYSPATNAVTKSIYDELRGAVIRQKSALEIAVTRRVVDKFYLGTYLELTLGKLNLHNQYSRTANSQAESNVILDLNGLSIRSIYTPFGSYADEIGGKLLAEIRLALRVHWTQTSPVYLDGCTSDWLVNITKNQLSLILDILNENLSGGGYNPQPVQVDIEQDEVSQIRKSLEQPPTRISFRMRLPKLQLNCQFTPDRPICEATMDRIYIGCDANIYTAFNVYGFGLYGDTLSIVDARKNSVNTYRLGAQCKGGSSNARVERSSSSEAGSTRHGNALSKMSWGEDKTTAGNDLAAKYPWVPSEAFEFHWMRSDMKDNDNRRLSVEGFEEILYESIPSESSPTESIRLYFVSNLTRSKFELDLLEPQIFTLVILGMDVFDFISSSLAFSSMKRFPKPIVAVVTDSKGTDSSSHRSTQEILGDFPIPTTSNDSEKSLEETTSSNPIDFLLGASNVPHGAEKKPVPPERSSQREIAQVKARTESGRIALPENSPFVFAIYAHRGSFLIPSNMKTSIDVLRWETDLLFSGKSDQNGVLFQEFSFPGGMIEILSDISDSQMPMQTSGRIISRSFEVLGRGSYKCLFDPVLQQNPRGQRGERLKQLNELLYQFLMTGQTPAIFVGEAFLTFRVPDSNFKVTGQDMGVAVAAARSFMQDLPSASTGQPPPPVMPPIYTPDQEQRTIIFVDSSDQSMFRFFNIDISIDQFVCIMCDDFRSSTVPVMKLNLQLPRMSLRHCPNSTLYAIENTEVRLDYMNSVIGQWEPFIEQLNVNTAYRSSIPLKRLLLFHREVLATQRLRREEASGGGNDTVVQLIQDFPWEDCLEGTYHHKSIRKALKCIRLHTTKPVYVNFTPRLVQTCLWFVPYMVKNLETSLEKKNKPSTFTRTTLSPTESKCLSFKEQPDTEKQSDSDELEGTEFANSAFKCLNLSGSPFVLARMSQFLEDVSFSALKLCTTTINPAFEPIYLDAFMSARLEPAFQANSTSERLPGRSQVAGTNAPTRINKLTKEETQEAFYLCPQPPANVIESVYEAIIARLSPGLKVSREAVSRSLVVTHSEEETIDRFLKDGERLRKQQTTSNSVVNPCPSFLREFSKGAKIYPIHLLKSSAVVVPTPFLTGMGDRDNCVAEILSPHPSFQLLLIGSTVRIANHGGVPIQVAFLDSSNNPIRLDGPLKLWRASTDLLSARFAQMALNRVTGLENGPPEGITSLFDSQAIDLNSYAEEWGLNPSTLPKSKRIPAVELKYSKPDSGFPHLQKVEGNIEMLMDELEWSTSTYIPNSYFMAVPPQVLESSGQVRMVFRPLGFLVSDLLAVDTEIMDVEDASERRALVRRKCQSTPLDGQGWCTILDSKEDCTPVQEKSKNLYLLPTTGIYRMRSCHWGKLEEEAQRRRAALEKPSKSSTKRNALKGRIGEKLFFEVCLAKRHTSLPAEATVRTITVFPPMVGINASPLVLELLVSPHKEGGKLVWSKGARVRIDSREVECYKTSHTILPGQSFIFYDFPPPSCVSNVDIKFRLMTPEHTDWSTPVLFRMPSNRLTKWHRTKSSHNIHGSDGGPEKEEPTLMSSFMEDSDDNFMDNSDGLEAESGSEEEDSSAIVSRAYIPGRKWADCCMEIRKESKDISAAIPRLVDPRQHAFVISAPHWFVDRTGLNIMPGSKDEKPCIPSGHYNHVRILEESVAESQQMMSLTLTSVPHSNGEHTQPTHHTVRVEVPPLGGYTNSTIESADGKVQTLLLRSHKIRLSDMAGALSRIVTLVPRYMLTNFCPWPIAVRQCRTQPIGLIRINPGKSKAMVWASKEKPLYMEFKPIPEELGFYWSSPIIVTEQTTGDSYMACPSSKAATHRFLVRVTPDDGMYSVTIGSAVVDSEAKASVGVFVKNACQTSSQINVSANPVHIETMMGPIPSNRSVTLGAATKPHPTISSENHDQHAARIVSPGEEACIAWPSPFVCKSRYLNLLIWLDSDTVAPKSQFKVNCSLDNFKPRRMTVEIQEDQFPNAAKKPLQKRFGESVIRLYVSIERKGDKILVTFRQRNLFGNILLSIPSAKHSPSPRIALPESSNRTLESSPNTESNGSENAPLVLKADYEVILDVAMSKIGVSFISEKLLEELLYAELGQLMLVTNSKGDTQTVTFRISDIQIDSQLERSEKAVLLANRGSRTKSAIARSQGDMSLRKSQSSRRIKITPKTDGGSTLSDNQLSVPIQHIQEENASESVPVLPTQSSVSGIKAFIDLSFERPAVVSKDWVFRDVKISLDDLELDMDIEVVQGIADFYSECLKSFGFSFSSPGIARGEVEKLYTAEPIQTNYLPARLPQCIVLESLQISEFTLHAWCSFLLDRVQFLGDSLIFLLRVLMASGRLELRGAPIKFDKEVILPSQSLRGSAKRIFGHFSEAYSAQIFNSLATLVGYSSLLNIPRVPVELLRTGVGAGLLSVDTLSSGLSSLMSNLTFDKEYINRRQRERLSAKKTSHNLSTGLQAAARNVGEGVLSLTNVVTKPIEGGRKGGMQGFAKGFAQGLMGTLIKPVDKLGQAVSNVVSGVRAEYVSRPMGVQKMVTQRRRKPRMLWGEHGQLREYNAGAADIRDYLGMKFAKNVLQCVVLESRSQPPKNLVLVLYPKKVSLLDLAARVTAEQLAAARRLQRSKSLGKSYSRTTSSPNRTSSVATPIILKHDRGLMLWTASITDIQQVIASSQGVIINVHRSNLKFQIPCEDPQIIRRVVQDLSAAQKGLRSELTIGRGTVLASSPTPVSVDHENSV